MDLIIPFLQDIYQNDSLEWFAANKDYYVKAFDRNAQYIQQLIKLIGKFDPTIATLRLSDCCFSIERDRRIKIDDRRYNDFFSGSFTRGGKYGGYASYYYHISPEPSSSGGSFLAVGIYRPNRELLVHFKRAIAELGVEQFDKMVKRTGFKVYDKERVKRVPGAIRADKKYEHYLHTSDMLLIMPLDIEWFKQEDWCKKCAKIFEKCKPFIDFVNSAIDSYKSTSPLPVGHGLRPIKRLERSAARRTNLNTEAEEVDADQYEIDD
jgi:uncharacterized protein (TIGR02453 family)